MSDDAKHCDSCGRRIEWRRKWAQDWTSVRWCSTACRRRKVRPVDRELEAAIIELLEQRARSATICPSDAAKRVATNVGDDAVDEAAWRELVEPARAAARRLVREGAVEICQDGRVVDASTAKGPIRIRRRAR